jgi:hypothetical protein
LDSNMLSPYCIALRPCCCALLGSRKRDPGKITEVPKKLNGALLALYTSFISNTISVRTDARSTASLAWPWLRAYSNEFSNHARATSLSTLVVWSTISFLQKVLGVGTGMSIYTSAKKREPNDPSLFSTAVATCLLAPDPGQVILPPRVVAILFIRMAVGVRSAFATDLVPEFVPNVQRQLHGLPGLLSPACGVAIPPHENRRAV